jgi:hypothetical protein
MKLTSPSASGYTTFFGKAEIINPVYLDFLQRQGQTDTTSHYGPSPASELPEMLERVGRIYRAPALVGLDPLDPLSYSLCSPDDIGENSREIEQSREMEARGTRIVGDEGYEPWEDVEMEDRFAFRSVFRLCTLVDRALGHYRFRAETYDMIGCHAETNLHRRKINTYPGPGERMSRYQWSA